MATINNGFLGAQTYVEYISEHGNASNIESYAVGNSRVTRVYDTSWPLRMYFMRTLLGYSVIRTAASGTKYVSRALPHAYADGTSYANSESDVYLWATSVDRVEGVSWSSKTALDYSVFQKARVHCTYSTLPYDVELDANMPVTDGAPDESYLTRYVTIKVTSGGQILSFAPQLMKFAEGPAVNTRLAGQGINKFLASSTIQLTRYQVPRRAVASRLVNRFIIPATAYLDLALGKVNSEVWLNFNPGTLLLLSYELRPFVSPFGDRVFEVVLNFKFLPTGHNKVWWPPAYNDATLNPPPFVKISANGTLYAENDANALGKHIYDAYDFQKYLFKVPLHFDG